MLFDLCVAGGPVFHLPYISRLLYHYSCLAFNVRPAARRFPRTFKREDKEIVKLESYKKEAETSYSYFS